MGHGFTWSEGKPTPKVPGCAASVPSDFEAELAAQATPLRQYLRRLSQSSPVDLDDLVQESLTRALRYRERFDGSLSLWPWLKRIAFHVLLDAQPLTTRPKITSVEDATTFAVDGQKQADQRESVQHLLSRLPELERTVLVRFHQGGESVREIASALRLPEGTVKSHLHRARRRLAQTQNEQDLL